MPKRRACLRARACSRCGSCSAPTLTLPSTRSTGRRPGPAPFSHRRRAWAAPRTSPLLPLGAARARRRIIIVPNSTHQDLTSTQARSVRLYGKNWRCRDVSAETTFVWQHCMHPLSCAAPQRPSTPAAEQAPRTSYLSLLRAGSLLTPPPSARARGGLMPTARLRLAASAPPPPPSCAREIASPKVGERGSESDRPSRRAGLGPL